MPFQTGQLVQVASRTRPGENKPGGVGRIVGVHNSTSSVDVEYLVEGGREKGIPLEFVQAHAFRETLRDRSLLLGRCRQCGSLRRDCHCLVVFPHVSAAGMMEDSSSDESLRAALADLDRDLRKYQRFKKKV